MSATDERFGRVLERLRRCEADQDLERLCDKGADREKLLRRLWVVQSHPREPRRLSKREALSYSRKIKAAAKLIEELKPVLGGDLLCGEDFHLTLKLPELLRAYANRVERLPAMVAEKWEPLNTAAMCQLVWYVKDSTGTYHDEEAAALIGAVTDNSEYSTEALKEWRNRHKKEIRSLGPLKVLPNLPRPPR